MNTDQIARHLLGTALLGIGVVLFYLAREAESRGPYFTIGFIAGVLLILVMAVGVYRNQSLIHLKTGITKFAALEVDYSPTPQGIVPIVEPRILDPETKSVKESFAQEIRKERPLPGDWAPKFSSLDQSNADELLVRPSAYPLTPMYLLDSAFRILDWNQAFTLAFDRTMEGRQGRSVLE